MTRERPGRGTRLRSMSRIVFGTVAFGLFAPSGVAGPPQRGQATTPREAAPIDLAGYWVSVVTEDWRWRMVTPPKGDYTGVPLNAEGRRLADTWDPAAAASDGCRAYGAAAVMRQPGRLNITWQDDQTLRVQTDAGAQTRVLNFDRARPPVAERSWQGYSEAMWERTGGRGQAGGGSLTVTTTDLRAGYLRSNGVPYSEDAVVTEYFDRLTSAGSEWLTVITVVEDPRYLTQPFITSTHFKQEPTGSGWMPTPCE